MTELQNHRITDRLKTVYSPKTTFCGGIIKIIKRGSVGTGGLDLTQNHLKLEKKTQKEEKKLKKKCARSEI